MCFEEVHAAETAALSCGHGPFCRECYADYLHEKVSDHGAVTILSTPCMGQGCVMRLSPMQWRRLANPFESHDWGMHGDKSNLTTFCHTPAAGCLGQHAYDLTYFESPVAEPPADDEATREQPR